MSPRMNATVAMKGKCTTCHKTFVVTQQQQAEAREMGCLFSSCCHAVATVEQVEVRQSNKGRRQ
jgi:hypothetical protein